MGVVPFAIEVFLFSLKSYGGRRMKQWYQMSKDEVLNSLGVTTDGLSSDKAKELLEKNG